MGWIRGIFRDIREKTGQMDKGQRLEYIAAYYWYHILFVAAGLGLVILFIRHLFFGEPPKEFTCVMVNQAVDYERDGRLGEIFAEVSGIDSELISMDSDYVFSYEGKQLEGVNESSYEKFFFRWGNGEVDAAVIPESFYKFCKGLEYEFVDLKDVLGEVAAGDEMGLWAGHILEDDGRWEGVYLKGTPLMEYVEEEEDDPVILVFLQNKVRQEAIRAFFLFAVDTLAVRADEAFVLRGI